MSDTHAMPGLSTRERQARYAWLRRLRLYSGLVLMAYLSTHLANHALGLVSLAAMEGSRVWFLALWRNPLTTVLLYGALGIHLCLALWSLYQRRRLRMPAWEGVQLLLGMAIPPLLTTHVVGTRLAHSWFDVADSYTYVVLALWHFKPGLGMLQTLARVIQFSGVGLHNSTEGGKEFCSTRSLACPARSA
jgi:adenylate cyclase